MPRLATTATLNDYPKLTISQYREQLRQDKKTVTALSVNYSYRGKQYEYDIPLTTTKPNYGGVRYWFKCINCSNRVSVLYCAGVYVCRHCIGAKYQTQHLQPIDRLFKRVAVIRERLGWYGGIAYGKGEKPLRMHHSTYEQLVREHDRLEQRLCLATLKWIDDNGVKVSYE